MNNYRKISSARISSSRNNYRNLCTAVMYNMAAMHRKVNKTEFQVMPTNQQRSRRSCDKSRGDNLVSYTAAFCNPEVHVQSDRSHVVHNCSAKIAVIVPA